jgi:site-specific DNA-methyltransferase (adenine-specific)
VLVSGEYQKVEIGNGTFYIGDCFDVMRDLPDGSVDVIVTDPPYRVISGGTKSKTAQVWKNTILEKNDGKIFKHNDVAISEYMREFYRILKPGSHCYVMINNLNLRELLNEAEAAGFGFHNLLVWVKNNCTPNRWYSKNLEYTCFFYKKPARMISSPNSKQTFFANNIRSKIHPTEKPVELFEHYILNSVKSGMMVLDPFGGSGAAALAAELNGAQWLSCEMDPEYAAKAIDRIRAHVEQKNVLPFRQPVREVDPLFVPVDSPLWWAVAV